MVRNIKQQRGEQIQLLEAKGKRRLLKYLPEYMANVMQYPTAWRKMSPNSFGSGSPEELPESDDMVFVAAVWK